MPNIIENIDHLLAKHFAGESLNQGEQEELKAWKEKNSKEYENLASLISSSHKVEQLNVDIKTAWNKVVAKKNKTDSYKIHKRKSTYFFWTGIAASLLLTIGILSWIFTLETQQIKLSNTSNTIKEISLPDGSLVTLNRNSSLEYSKNMNTERSLKLLKGEVFFNIKPDARRPFTILANTAEVKVLGTSFSIDITDNKTEVYVKTGSVSLSDKAEEIILKPGEKGTSENGVLTQEPIKDINYLAWKERVLYFKNSSLKAAIPQLEAYFDVKINTPQNYKDCFFTTTFTTETLQEALEELQLLLNFSYKIDKKEVSLYDINCK